MAPSGEKRLTLPPPPKRGRARIERYDDGRPVDQRPYLAREENQGDWNAALYMADFIGFPLICPRANCRREARCMASDRHDWPLCTRIYRGTLKFVLEYAMAEHGPKLERLTPPDGEPSARSLRPPGTRCPVPPTTSILAQLAAAGAPIEQLARPADGGFDPWHWSDEPEAREAVAEAKARRLARVTAGRGGPG